MKSHDGCSEISELGGCIHTSHFEMYSTLVFMIV